MNQPILITKRDGRKEPFDLEKVHKVLEWATIGITGVSISEIELKANIQLYDKIPAYSIHELLIKSAAELISENTPNYQYVAARLVNYKLRKEVYGQYEPSSLLDLIKANVDRKAYDADILKKYNIDSLQFVVSNEYYSKDLERYLKIYEEVLNKLETNREIVIDSIENYKKDRAKRSQEINLETPKNNKLSKPSLSGDLNSNILEN